MILKPSIFEQVKPLDLDLRRFMGDSNGRVFARQSVAQEPHMGWERRISGDCETSSERAQLDDDAWLYGLRPVPCID